VIEEDQVPVGHALERIDDQIDAARSQQAPDPSRRIDVFA
jgi:hypothetical protein